MPERLRKAAGDRFRREGQTLCPACHGTGRVSTQSVSARARLGGNSSFLRSLEPGALSMTERGRRGGRPAEPKLRDL